MKKHLSALCAALILLAIIVAPIACQKAVQPNTPAAAATVADAVVLPKLSITGISCPVNSSYLLANLTDGNLNTLWSAETDANVYLADPNSQIVVFRLDTTVMQSVDYIKMAFFIGGNKTLVYHFDVQVSQDGQGGWVTVLYDQKSAPNNTALQTFEFPDTRGKYVRLVGHGNTGAYPKANSWTEVEIYGAPAPASTSIKLNIPAANATADTYIPPYVPANAIDGNLNTNWASRMNGDVDYKSIVLSLGNLRTVDFVKLYFPSGGDLKRVSRFGVFVSTDSTNWTKVIAGTFSAGAAYGQRLETFDFPDAQARYVKVQCYGHTGTNSPTYNNSIGELEVWAQPSNSLCKISSIIQNDSQVVVYHRKGTFFYNDFGQPTFAANSRKHITKWPKRWAFLAMR